MTAEVVNPTLLELNLGDLGVECNLVARQGADADRLVLTLTDSAGAAVDVAGCTVEAQVRKLITDPAAACSFTATLSSPQIWLDLPAATLAGLTAGADARDDAGLYRWDCRITFTDTSKRWLAWGELRVLKAYTRP